MVSLTEPDKNDKHLKVPKRNDDDMPVVHMINPNKTQLGGPVHEQARSRDILIQEGAYRRLLVDKHLQE